MVKKNMITIEYAIAGNSICSCAVIVLQKRSCSIDNYQKHSGSIRFLILSPHALVCRTSEAIGKMLQANDTLIQLNFGKNNLNRKCGAAFFGGIGYLNQGLKFNCNLRTLNIAFTGVCRTLEGIQNLANVLSRDNCAIETLDISSCGLTGEYMAALNAGLNVSRLRLLVLDGNPIQSSGNGYSTLMSKTGRKRYIRDFLGKC